MIKQVTSFQTSDDRFFQDPHKAKWHEAFVQFSTWYESSDDAQLSVPTITPAELFDWITDNEEQIRAVLSYDLMEISNE